MLKVHVSHEALCMRVIADLHIANYTTLKSRYTVILNGDWDGS